MAVVDDAAVGGSGAVEDGDAAAGLSRRATRSVTNLLQPNAAKVVKAMRQRLDREDDLVLQKAERHFEAMKKVLAGVDRGKAVEWLEVSVVLEGGDSI